jgi:hypothetical protein
MISNVAKVVVPVDDQQAAVEFWTTTMGFSVVRDDTYGDERWIEVKPPNQDLRLVLSPRPDEPRRTVPTGCRTRICSSTVPTSSRLTPSSAAAA